MHTGVHTHVYSCTNADRDRYICTKVHLLSLDAYVWVQSSTFVPIGTYMPRAQARPCTFAHLLTPSCTDVDILIDTNAFRHTQTAPCVMSRHPRAFAYADYAHINAHL